MIQPCSRFAEENVTLRFGQLSQEPNNTTEEE